MAQTLEEMRAARDELSRQIEERECDDAVAQWAKNIPLDFGDRLVLAARSALRDLSTSDAYSGLSAAESDVICGPLTFEVRVIMTDEGDDEGDDA